MKETRIVTVKFEYSPRHSSCEEVTDKELLTQLKAHLGYVVQSSLHVPTEIDGERVIKSFTLVDIT